MSVRYIQCASWLFPVRCSDGFHMEHMFVLFNAAVTGRSCQIGSFTPARGWFWRFLELTQLPSMFFVTAVLKVVQSYPLVWETEDEDFVYSKPTCILRNISRHRVHLAVIFLFALDVHVLAKGFSNFASFDLKLGFLQCLTHSSKWASWSCSTF